MTNVLEHQILCAGDLIDVVTVQAPGETLVPFVARHNAELQEARDDCSAGSAAQLHFNATWRCQGENVTYRAPASYGQTAFDADVSALLAGPYPKDA